MGMRNARIEKLEDETIYHWDCGCKSKYRHGVNEDDKYFEYCEEDKPTRGSEIASKWMDDNNVRWEGSQQTGWMGSALIEALLSHAIDEGLSQGLSEEDALSYGLKETRKKLKG